MGLVLKWSFKERKRIVQDQCITSNNIKTKIDGTRNDPKWQMCKAKDETITCPKFLQKEYKRLHVDEKSSALGHF